MLANCTERLILIRVVQVILIMSSLDSALNSKQQKKKKSRESLTRVSLSNVNYRYNLWILFALNSAWIHLLEAQRKKAKEKELS